MGKRQEPETLDSLVEDLRRLLRGRYELAATAAAKRARAQTLRDLAELFVMPADRQRLKDLAQDAEAEAERADAELASLNG
jgi:hypothetical protein